jgi:hypothetical protein
VVRSVRSVKALAKCLPIREREAESAGSVSRDARKRNMTVSIHARVELRAKLWIWALLYPA